MDWAAWLVPDLRNCCRKVGWNLDWICPPGFVVDDAAPKAASGLPLCKPDPADCGSDPFGGIQEGGGNAFVDANAPAGGNGSRAKPFQHIIDAAKATGQGATLAIAAGKYTLASAFSKGITVRGRCAAMVTLSGGSLFVLSTFDKKPEESIKIWGVTVSGQGMAPIDIGAGVMVLGGDPALELDHVFISGTRLVGIDGHQPGGRVRIVNSVIDRMKVGQFKGEDGVGISVYSGARVELERVRISGAHRIAVLARGQGTTPVGREVLIDGRLVDAKTGLFGRALGVQSGARVRLFRAKLVGSLDTAVYVSGAGSWLDGSAIDIDRVGVGKSKPSWGRGLEFNGGAGGRLSGIRVRNQSELALLGSDGGNIAVDGLEADGSGSEVRGRGIVLQGRVKDSKLSGLWLHNLADIGLRIQGKGSEISARNCTVDDVIADENGQQEAAGIEVKTAARATIDGLRVHRATTYGISLAHADTYVSLRDALVTQTRPNALSGDFGRGLNVQEGAGRGSKTGVCENARCQTFPT